MFINWSELVEWSDSGTILESYTLRKLMHDLEFYIQQERIGIPMARGLVSWGALLKNELKMDPQNVDMKKVLNWLEKDLNSNLSKLQTQGRSSGASNLDPEFAKSAGKFIHTILSKHGHELNIDMLTAFYASESKTKLDLEDVKEQLRYFIKSSPDFSIGAGASPKVVQLKDKSGETTGKKAFNNTRKTNSGGTRKAGFKGLLRNSDATKKVFTQLKIATDDVTFDNWRGYCQMNNIADPDLGDLAEFQKQTEN